MISAVLGLAAIVALLVAVVTFSRSGGTAESSQVRSAPPTPTSGQQPSASASPSTPGLVDTPAQAMALTAGEAREELRKKRKVDRHDLDSLAYVWAPQVSSKCEGLDNVDLKPHWFADGDPETDNLTAQQILAYHLALASRDDALMVIDRDVGVRTTYPGCQGNPMWMALVPRSFASAASANRWCDRNGYTLGECAARYVVPSGKSGSRVVWRR